MLITNTKYGENNVKMPKITQWTAKALEHQPHIPRKCLKLDDFIIFRNFCSVSIFNPVNKLGRFGDDLKRMARRSSVTLESSSKTNLTFTTAIT